MSEDHGHCPLHGDPLRQGTVGIAYGLPVEDYMQARERLFPHADEPEMGG